MVLKSAVISSISLKGNHVSTKSSPMSNFKFCGTIESFFNCMM